MSKAPIALFVFKRPDHTRRVLESLRLNEGISESELYIFSDGPRGEEDRRNVEVVRSIVNHWKVAKSVHVIEEKQNKGLAASIIDGVSRLVNSDGRVIVLEEDLVLSPQFLNYMNDALDNYREDYRVMHISGYLLPLKEELPETFFLRSISSWGWATWDRAWELFEPDTQKLLCRFKDRRQKRDFDLNRSIDFYNMLADQNSGLIDSWAIRWYASIFLNDGLCLHPGWSLVRNAGHDGTGRHCRRTDVYDVEAVDRRITHFERRIAENEEAVRLYAQFYRSQRPPLYQRLIHLMKRSLPKSSPPPLED